MPDCKPAADEMDLILNVLDNNGLLELPSRQLLPAIKVLAKGELPPPLVGSMLPAPSPLCLALSVVVALLKPRDSLDPAIVRQEISEAQSELLAVWDDPGHNFPQKLRKTVSHAIVFGARKGWQRPKEVIYHMILGDELRLAAPLLKPDYEDRARPAGRPKGAIEASIEYLHGMVPDLNDCLTDPIEDASFEHAAWIQAFLEQALLLVELQSGDFVEFESHTDGVRIPPFKIVPAGSRRNFLLRTGKAKLIGPAGELLVPAGQRIMLRALDEGHCRIQLAVWADGAIAGPIMTLKQGQSARLEALEPSTLEVWECSCGTWQCPNRHRMSGWDPAALDRRATLESFVWTAVKGPTRGFDQKAFITGMYYALLASGDDRIRQVKLLSCSKLPSWELIRVLAALRLTPVLNEWESAGLSDKLRERVVADVAGVLDRQRVLDGPFQLAETTIRDLRVALSPERTDALVSILEPLFAELRDDLRPRLSGRTEVVLCELKDGLLPFSSLCSPEMGRFRRCWCGSWVLDGLDNCSFCGSRAPKGPTTRAWIRRRIYHEQLKPYHAPGSHPSDDEIDDDQSEKDLIEPETKDYDPDWEDGYGQAY